MSSLLSKFSSPIPESCKIWGELIAPADNITSLIAWIVRFTLPLFWRQSTPIALLPSKITLLIWVPVMIVKFFLALTLTFKNERYELLLNPLCVVCWKYPTPSCFSPLQSALNGIPISSEALIKRSAIFLLNLRLETFNSPSIPWYSFSPFSWHSNFLNRGRTSLYDQPLFPSFSQLS